MKERSDFLRVYYSGRGTLEIRSGLPAENKSISAEHLTELAYQLLKIAAYAKKPLVSQTTDVFYAWNE
ncbi:hypothetical protein JWZ98_10110 [Methylomonas sp. EFPC1]|uniref:hypothetical protein n=1 Tax=Methylomonas sp. EFPC1 TaxID=2812647 RepID=UPI001966D9F8|nr:hypothetical protein [Methylomonas sp. EFPC1]QSB03248.1 hypothetical protein JWZ98_10110 [Methylomonas sp. EFPC1]